MEIVNKEHWEKWVDNNTDPYGSAVVRYAERWADLMEQKINTGEKLVDIASKTSDEADTEGITGFMYGYAVQVLSDVWKYGEDLRLWHNKKYKYEGSGAVNPAIITIGVQKED